REQADSYRKDKQYRIISLLMFDRLVPISFIISTIISAHLSDLSNPWPQKQARLSNNVPHIPYNIYRVLIICQLTCEYRLFLVLQGVRVGAADDFRIKYYNGIHNHVTTFAF
ncbi:unnamed protein product, partial [Sphacelaria rigidula]